MVVRMVRIEKLNNIEYLILATHFSPFFKLVKIKLLKSLRNIYSNQ
jgi:hypothetical protein